MVDQTTWAAELGVWLDRRERALWLARFAAALALAMLAIRIDTGGGGPMHASVRAAFASRDVIEAGGTLGGGLDGWQGDRAGWSRTWVRDGGAIRPGRAALLAASRGFGDYRIETMVTLSGGLTCIYRASDTANYDAFRLAVAEPGPRPQLDLELTRVRGRRVEASRRARVATVTADKPVLLALDMAGSEATLSADGIELERWPIEGDLPNAAGLTGGPGDASLVHWFKVKRTPFLARVWAVLTPVAWFR